MYYFKKTERKTQSLAKRDLWIFLNIPSRNLDICGKAYCILNAIFLFSAACQSSHESFHCLRFGIAFVVNLTLLFLLTSSFQPSFNSCIWEDWEKVCLMQQCAYMNWELKRPLTAGDSCFSTCWNCGIPFLVQELFDHKPWYKQKVQTFVIQKFITTISLHWNQTEPQFPRSNKNWVLKMIDFLKLPCSRLCSKTSRDPGSTAKKTSRLQAVKWSGSSPQSKNIPDSRAPCVLPLGPWFCTQISLIHFMSFNLLLGNFF